MNDYILTVKNSSNYEIEKASITAKSIADAIQKWMLTNGDLLEDGDQIQVTEN